jgi:hypothetical protein
LDLRRFSALVERARALPAGPARAWILRGLTAQAALAGVASVGRRLDDVVAPAWRAVPIREPVFVVGHPRSGTTRLHRLLALDPRFTAIRAWEALLPSVCVQRAVRRGVAADARWLRGGLLKRVRALEGRLLAPLAGAHPTALDAPEEDELLRLRHFDAPWYAVTALGAPDAFAGRWSLDPLPDRDAALADYIGSVRRHLLLQPRTWLSKNPHHLGGLRTLGEAFPDGWFIQAVRDPEDAIASQLSLYRAAWQRVDPARDVRPWLEAMFEVCCALYRDGFAGWEALPPGRRVIVRYADLGADPSAATRAVYEQLGWVMPAGMQARLAAEPAFDGPRRAPSLRQLGIPPSRLAERLGDLDPLWRALNRRPPRGRGG